MQLEETCSISANMMEPCSNILQHGHKILVIFLHKTKLKENSLLPLSELIIQETQKPQMCAIVTLQNQNSSESTIKSHGVILCVEYNMLYSLTLTLFCVYYLCRMQAK